MQVTRSAPPGSGINRSLSTLCAITAGLSAANIYYAQPLLNAIGTTFHTGPGLVSLVVTAGTVGYTIGMILLVPRGDLANRRRLITRLLGLVAVCQAVSAAAPSFGVLLPAALIAAIGSVVSPLMVSFVATLATESERGRATGKVMSGVLLGVLMARTAGGLVAQVAGWRAVYLVAAVLVAALALTVRRVLPEVPAQRQVGYGALLRSVPALLREEPVLRLRCAYGFVSLAGFNALWTCVGLLLARPPYSYGTGLIGLFGVAGAVGAVAARVTGRLADRGLDRLATVSLLLVVVASWAAMAVDGGGSLVALVIGIVALDFGVQGMQVTNLSVIYRLRPEARSRLTTAYLTIYFAGGIAGSAGGSAAYAAFGWAGVCVVGAGFAVLALLIWAADTVVAARGRAEDVRPADIGTDRRFQS